MGYIEPNTIVGICRNIPLSSDYIHTLDFDTAVKQAEYFNTKVKFLLHNYSYQRKNGSLKVNLSTEDLYDCNYLFYQNKRFENKYFYAFITNIEYVNNTTSIIFFEEDVMQTWQFDYYKQSCYIVRQHCWNDTIGLNNTVEEGLEYGQYVYYYHDVVTYNLIPVIASGVIPSFESTAVTPVNLADYPSGESYLQALNFTACKTPEQCAVLLNNIQVAGYKDSVVSVCMMPDFAFNSVPGNYLGTANFGTALDSGLGRYTLSTEIKYNGYGRVNYPVFTPKNNKTYYYPYRFVQVTNGDGQEIIIRTELLKDPTKFQYEVVISLEPSPVMMLVPTNYKNAYMDANTSLALHPYPVDDRLSIVNFPLCSYTIDTYLTWYAQNNIMYQYQSQQAKDDAYFNVAQASVGAAKDMVTSAISGILSLNPGAVANAAIDGVYNVGSEIAKGKHDMQALAAQQSAQKTAAKVNSINTHYSGSSVAGFVADMNTFHIYLVGITPEYAQKIDGYFSAYGYAVNAYGTPLTKTRKYWNYIKTIGSNVGGSIPQYAINAINALYDNGITIWHDPNQIGNYILNNEITGVIE